MTSQQHPPPRAPGHRARRAGHRPRQRSPSPLPPPLAAQAAAPVGDAQPVGRAPARWSACRRRCRDVFVANDEIADVQVKLGDPALHLRQGGGETTVYATNAAGAVVYSANVRVGSNIDSVDEMLRAGHARGRASRRADEQHGAADRHRRPPEDAARRPSASSRPSSAQSTQVVSRLRTATPLQVNLRSASPRSAARWSSRSA